MKVGDLVVTDDEAKFGIVLDGARDWFHRRGDKYIDMDKEPNLFYIYWVDITTGKKQSMWHKETESIILSSTVYGG
jgi:hypothetical protein|tara:strand:- start:320 stop:547 length:228 start_codon:yes stop_codon:yes gene_type:complete